MKRYDKHIFVCENRREEGNPKGSCAQKGSMELTLLLKKRIAELGLNGEIRVNSSGCLGACELGPVIVVYPEQIWYGGIKTEDVEDIIQSHILNNTPVKRLFIKDRRYYRDEE